MSSQEPTLYDLFDETSFEFWRRQVQAGVLPTAEQLARLLEANPDQPLPPWLGPILSKALRGELKAKRGRPPRESSLQTRLWLARADYIWRLDEARDAARADRRAENRPIPKGRLHRPAHERIAAEVVTRWKLPIHWRSFLNQLHSRK